MSGQATVTIGAKQWSCQVANTYSELVTGLSGVASIPANTGMLFDPRSVTSSIPISMASMLFPLDIIFVDVNGLVSQVFSNVQPGQTGVVGTNARYFMEVNAGETASVVVGDVVTIEGDITIQDQINIEEIIMLAMVIGMMGAMMAMAMKEG